MALIVEEQKRALVKQGEQQRERLNKVRESVAKKCDEGTHEANEMKQAMQEMGRKLDKLTYQSKKVWAKVHCLWENFTDFKYRIEEKAKTGETPTPPGTPLRQDPEDKEYQKYLDQLTMTELDVRFHAF